jgi:hypothetical protein
MTTDHGFAIRPAAPPGLFHSKGGADMMFVCYSVTLGMLGFAYYHPGEILLLVMLLTARSMLR